MAAAIRSPAVVASTERSAPIRGAAGAALAETYPGASRAYASTCQQGHRREPTRRHHGTVTTPAFLKGHPEQGRRGVLPLLLRHVACEPLRSMYLVGSSPSQLSSGPWGFGLPYEILTSQWHAFPVDRAWPSPGVEVTPRAEIEAPSGGVLLPGPATTTNTSAANEATPPADWDDAVAVPATEPTPASPSATALPAPPDTPAPLGTTAPKPPAPSPCGPIMCSADQQCCNASCGICVVPGSSCTNKVCSRPEIPFSVTCGQNTCNVGQVCCNASCGTCVLPGETCASTTCDGPTIPFSVTCGMNTCNVGQVCCNASCGVCTPPGASCSQDLCAW